jgi:hypothetical protein
MSYNTQFKVKYNDIEKELIHKLKNKTPEEYEENPDEEHEYSAEDVLDICNKLYRDELLSVFGADDFVDDKIDLGMKYVFEKMCTNTEFHKIIEEMTQLCINTFLQNEQIDEQKLLDLKQMIIITLFSQHVFYITHKCVCQQIEVGTIDDELLVELKKHSIELFKNQFGV